MKIYIALPFTLMLSACGINQTPCERILEVKQQEQQCQKWRKIMREPGHPQQSLTAKKQYEQACENLRYYRDQFDTICKGDEKPITPQNKP